MNVAIFVNLLGHLRQNSLGVIRGHAQERDDPHPKDSTRAARQDCTARTNDVARANLSGNSGCQRLKRAHAAFLLAAAQRKAAEHAAPAFAKAANLHETRTNGKEQTCSHQQKEQNVIG